MAREDYRYWEFRCSCGDGPWRYIGREPEARARLAVLRAAGHKGDGHDLEMRGREL